MELSTDDGTDAPAVLGACKMGIRIWGLSFYLIKVNLRMLRADTFILEKMKIGDFHFLLPSL